MTNAITKKFLVVRKGGSREGRHSTDHYTLEAIIAVGYISEFDRETAKYLKGGEPN